MRLIILFFVILAIIGSIFLARKEKKIVGRVISCESGEPIAGAVVSALQHGWGISNGQLAWDKDYITTAVSDSSGSFALAWRVGRSVKLESAKEGYLNAAWFADPGANIAMRMRTGDSHSLLSVTYDCKTSSECLSCNTENGVRSCKNICFPG